MPLEERVEFGTAPQMITAVDDFTKAADGRELKRVDIACGQRKKEGYVGIDRVADIGVDLVHDLEQYPWPFDDESIYEFHCSHFVEHVKDLVKFMEEAWRCLMPGGTIEITAPYYTSVRAWQDPTHVRGITDVTFAYFCKDTAKTAHVDHYTGKCNFELVTRTFILNKEFEGHGKEALDWMSKHWLNVVDDIYIVLRKRPLIVTSMNDEVVR